MSLWSDLAPVAKLSEPLVQYLVAQVTAQITNRTKTKGQLDVHAISKEFENEGLEWSNKKVSRVTDALKSLIIAYLAGYTAETSAELKQTLKEEITARSAI